MKILIASDLHGSFYYAERIVQRFKEEKADKMVFLGDIYNHGPRNPLPKDYAPLKVAEILNANKGDIIVIKGKCDSEVDTMISEFDFNGDTVIMADGKSLFLTHGHIYNKDKLPKTNYDAVIYGHFHTGFIEGDSPVVANAGSLSLPKGGTANSYLIYEKGVLYLKDIDGNIIKEKII